MMTFPFDPMTPPDASSSPEQNILLQPSTYQPATPDPAPPTHQVSSTETSGHTASSSSQSSGSAGDTVQLSTDAQIKQLSSQGMSAADIAQTIGTTVASVDSSLNIQPTTTPTSSSHTTATINVTL
jgi:hypothetical protein